MVVRYIVTAEHTATENLADYALLSNLGFQIYSLKTKARLNNYP